MSKIKKYFPLFSLIILFTFAGCSSSSHTSGNSSVSFSNNQFNPDTVKAQKFDTGKMWTFDFPPLDYFSQTYNFKPDKAWLDDVRMSALRFANWCSASFVSEDGLIMTNNHCSDFTLEGVQKEGEDLRTTGFIAESLTDERKHPTLYVDQLVSIEDVTAEIRKAVDAAETDDQKTAAKKNKISEITSKRTAEDGLVYRVIELYNGGRYSLYGYKRYSDIRLVLIPESELGLYGGDPDNYTYPRYSLDFTFWRAYENDKPVKVDNYFKWSSSGAKEGEPLFVIGNPGNTNKLKTLAQLEYMRDFSTKQTAFIYNELQSYYEELIKQYPDRRQQYIDNLSGYANNAKRNTGLLRGLNNPYYLARKLDFERQFKKAVLNDPKLKDEYGSLWDHITETRAEMSKIAPEYYGLLRSRAVVSQYIKIAADLVELAEELKKPAEARADDYKGEKLQALRESIFPEEFDAQVQAKRLQLQAGLMYNNLGADNPYYKQLFGSYKGEEAVKYALSRTVLGNKDDVNKLASGTADQILSHDDPFLNFIKMSSARYNEVMALYAEINKTEEIYENKLGEALFAVYGTSIPPDGSGTLRIGDGVLKSYSYNGTIAPLFTTYYGLYDRFYSFNKEFPWSLPERWQNPSEDFDLSTKYNFISTHDIVGGSSGSPVINKEQEIVGLAFDGNIESNSGYFIYDTAENRMISVASQGILEAVQDMYKLKRLSEELKNGKITEVSSK